jgi:hypothetical protein
MVALLAIGPGVRVAAQERIDQVDLPRSVADQVIDFFNDPSTIRFTGRVDIPAGRVVMGDVAVLGGPVTIAGEIQGDLVVVNGNVTIEDVGTVSGDVTIIGGVAHATQTQIGGQLAVYAQNLPYRQSGERITYDEHRWNRWRENRDLSHISVRVEQSYNRVEGLPVMFGPVVQTSGPDRFRLDALAIWRSESGPHLASNELGYLVRAEQHLGPGGRFLVGGSAQSQVQPIESWQLTNLEASLAAFLLHDDYRDYYKRAGFAAFAGYDDPSTGVRLTGEYRSEDQGFLAPVSPWTLRRNAEPWRAQPLVGEGRITTLSGDLVVDRRNDPDDPSDGWYLQARATFGVSGSLAIPAYFEAEPNAPTLVAPARTLPTDFQAGFVDLRRYTRLGPDSDLRLRGVLAGSLDDSPLPPQYQHTLGGEGSLPGYALMSVDCGARSRPYSIFQGPTDDPVRTPTFARYGCDRIALFQAEYRGSLSFNMNLGSNRESDADPDWSWYPAIDLSPSWVVFFDAGRGWSLSGDTTDPGLVGSDTQTLMDLGAGIYLGDVGVYWAWPLNGNDRRVNFFLRIAHRF